MSILNIVKTFGAACTDPKDLSCIDDPMGGQSLMETVTTDFPLAIQAKLRKLKIRFFTVLSA